MSTKDEDFLAPRGLLVEGSFVCSGPSFKEFSAAIDESLNLPYSAERFYYWCGISPKGYEILVNVFLPIVNTCYDAVKAAQVLGSAYREVGTVCDRILDTASTAQPDYDAMFQGLNDLTDDPNNEELRRKVQKLISGRLDGVTTLENKTDATFGQLKEGTDGVKEFQDQLQDFINRFDIAEMEAELREYDFPESVNDDIAALSFIQENIASLNIGNQSGGALHDMQLALGAVRVIMTDLGAIKDSIENSSEPANELILGHEKAKIIRKWNDLAVEVQKFKEHYIDPSRHRANMAEKTR